MSANLEIIIIFFELLCTVCLNFPYLQDRCLLFHLFCGFKLRFLRFIVASASDTSGREHLGVFIRPSVAWSEGQQRWWGVISLWPWLTISHVTITALSFLSMKPITMSTFQGLMHCCATSDPTTDSTAVPKWFLLYVWLKSLYANVLHAHALEVWGRLSVIKYTWSIRYPLTCTMKLSDILLHTPHRTLHSLTKMNHS